MGSSVERAEGKETGRIEAFSDGVFAFAITLLVLYLKDPATDGRSLVQGLIDQWPAFFAFVTSFMTILIMWVGHHQMFTFVRRIDRKFMFLNGFLLLFVTLTPFTTSLVADHILSSDSQTAAVIYASDFVFLSFIWGNLARYARRNNLFTADGGDSVIRNQGRGALIGLTFYLIALVVAFFSGIASVALILVVAVFYAVDPTSQG